MSRRNFQTCAEALLTPVERPEIRSATTNPLLLQLVEKARSPQQDGQHFQQPEERPKWLEDFMDELTRPAS
ncbi:MAG TPA: hypothetical protein VF690_10965 [Hymenobacter sp.]|jgi:hypothetical protein